MQGKNLLEGRTGPVTQSVDAVKSLLIHMGKAISPLPSDVSLDNGRLVLILSNKKDAYYTCTSRACSCPGNQFTQNCKHQRKYFATPKKSRVELETEGESILAAHNPGAKRLARPPEDSSIRPTGKWPGGLNGPVDECVSASSSKGTA